ncbi:hypothetical protein [Endozoicomonas sp.]|uniref:hypothetical protein n=1 Tax=Endozoicomonas sp. TaxID=1892382 RepID=UPI00383AB6BD
MTDNEIDIEQKLKNIDGMRFMKGYNFKKFITVFGWWATVILAAMIPNIIWTYVFDGNSIEGEGIYVALLSVVIYFYMAIHVGLKKFGVYGYRSWEAFTFPISLFFVGFPLSLMPSTGFMSILFIFPGFILSIIPMLIIDKLFAKKMKAKLRSFVEDKGYNIDYYECDGDFFCAIDFSKPAICFGSYWKNVEIKPSDIRAIGAVTSERTIQAGSLPVSAKDNMIRIKTSIEGFEDLHMNASSDDMEHGIFGSQLKKFMNLDVS